MLMVVVTMTFSMRDFPDNIYDVVCFLKSPEKSGTGLSDGISIIALGLKHEAGHHV